MSVLDSFTEGILILAGIGVGSCASMVLFILINLKKKNIIINKEQ